MKDRIAHIFFDLDHTLWDFDRNSMLAFEKIFKKFKINVTVEDFLKVYQPVNLKYWKLYREDQVSKKEMRRRRLQETFEPMKIKLSLASIDEIAEDYITFLPDNNYLIEGTEEVLAFLNPSYQMHIITNGFKEVQYQKLERSGIRKYFKTITNSEEAGFKKPHPIIFETAIEESGADPAESLMIGDNYEADILGADQMGWHTICFNYHNEKIPANYLQINKLVELKKYL
ncbi:YjjG family noncanonical pyrimidine nucleotidase [Aquimarina brevivitae]|uniref:Putative hydrolase of the HAD superfamily n=1 Tax=Aquimarina brevivitae TaxID=323412 RepID=A0A4Q7PHP2_9FLAO|nr:YjjG family noncanonical pyrimidine nucleotidase [Aquimarina brevivitae]RZS99935.1 putative hydrolase of the HAD superfamily [Aquimarina brevivitae]